MVDNVAISAGVGTSVAADDISSVFYQRVKLSLGADGTAVDAIAGAGSVSTAVQRVTLASDDPAVASLDIIADAVVTDAPDDTAVAGNPYRQGGHAVSSITTSRVSAANDTADIITDLDRTLLVRPYGCVADKISGTLTNTNGSVTDVIAAQAANIATCLTHISIFNSSASGVAVDILDGATIKLTAYIPATSGWSAPLPCPLVGSAATAWRMDAASATTTLYCNMIGYLAKVS